MLNDLTLLRSFLAVVETGSMSAAAGRVLRTQAAISQQMKRLEEALGVCLLDRAGRRIRPTEPGERLVGYARRMLDLADEAVLAVTAAAEAGEIRLGMVQDLADSLLPAALQMLSRTHPGIRVAIVVDRSTRLTELMDEGALDLAVATRMDRPDAIPLREEPMVWLGASGAPVERWRTDTLPLVVVDAPCPFRAAAITALDRVGLKWHVAYQSPSVSGLMAAVRAGLGVTPRTALTAGDLTVIGSLPSLPPVQFALYRRIQAPAPAVSRFEAALRMAIGAGAQEHL